MFAVYDGDDQCAVYRFEAAAGHSVNIICYNKTAKAGGEVAACSAELRHSLLRGMRRETNAAAMLALICCPSNLAPPSPLPTPLDKLFFDPCSQEKPQSFDRLLHPSTPRPSPFTHPFTSHANCLEAS
ncbi:hypothetical protein AOLI_G00082030 [Acnodon oligacanthus]